jgi:hypothetical protein
VSHGEASHQRRHYGPHYTDPPGRTDWTLRRTGKTAAASTGSWSSSIEWRALSRRSKSSGSSNHSSAARTPSLSANASSRSGRINDREGSRGALCTHVGAPPTRRVRSEARRRFELPGSPDAVSGSSPGLYRQRRPGLGPTPASGSSRECRPGTWITPIPAASVEG